MLREIESPQTPGEPRRRWFSDEDFDLVVWVDDLGAVASFQLCYDRTTRERAVTWSAAGGCRPYRVDAGDDSPFGNLAPILLPGGRFPNDQVIAKFAGAASAIDPAIRSFVAERLRASASASDGLEP